LAFGHDQGFTRVAARSLARVGSSWRLAIAGNKSKNRARILSMGKDWSTFGPSSSGRASVRMLFRGWSTG